MCQICTDQAEYEAQLDGAVAAELPAMLKPEPAIPTALCGYLYVTSDGPGKTLVSAAIKEMTPRDIRSMEQRLELVEDSENLLRAFVVYDELWHFSDDHNEARHGLRPAVRMTFDAFEAK